MTKLMKPTTESWLYLACYREQEKQVDAIRWMTQHIHPTGHGLLLKNIRPVIRARTFLVKNKCLKELTNLENPHVLRLLSKPDPFITYAEMKLNTPRPRKGKLTFSGDEREVLLKILDSCWFRQSFWADLEMKQLGTDGALRTLAEFAEEVFAIPVAINRHEPKPPIELILQAGTFDDFMVTWSKTNIEPDQKIRSRLATVAARLRRMFPGTRTELFIKNTLEHSSFAPLCIPSDLAEKVCRVGNIPFTFTRALEEGLRDSSPRKDW